MLKVGIIGASGYTGAELARVLSGHPKVEITVITSRKWAGRPLGDCYPGLAHIDLKFVNHVEEDVTGKADLFFTALPHKAAMEAVKSCLDAGKKVVDLSADFRLADVKTYEEHYGPHSCPELLSEAVYGLAEIYGDEIAGARLVANPGCYPTSALLPLYPLIKEGIIDAQGLIIDAKSGVTGAGRDANETTHFCHAHESIKAYKIASHRHTPEIEAQLSLAAGDGVQVVFTPHLIPMGRGMLSTIYATPAPNTTTTVTREAVESVWAKAYADSPFVNVAKGDGLPDSAHVRGTNCCIMAVRVDERNGRLIILSAIDNLAKGASTQAIQNMNIMMGWDQSEGLDLAPLYP